MASNDQSPVRYEVLDGAIAVVTLDRPAARNAVNAAVAVAVEQYVDEIEGDEAIRVAVLASSHDRVFCAGADLGEIAAGNAARLSTMRGGFGGLARRARTKPWIAAVDGAAVGGGCELMLACDMLVASTQARFALPEVKRGLYPGAGGPLRLQRVLPRAIALELLCTGDPIGAERAYAFGMVNRLTAPGAALEEALVLARTIAANAPVAVRETLADAREALGVDEAAFWRRTDATMARILATDDAQEGARAFLAKRDPVWTGR